MEIFTKIANWFESTHIDEQLRTVDYMGLLTNPWFIVPFAVAIVYMLYKQRWTRLLITAVVNRGMVLFRNKLRTVSACGR